MFKALIKWCKQEKQKYLEFSNWYDIKHEQQLINEEKRMKEIRAQGGIFPPLI